MSELPTLGVILVAAGDGTRLDAGRPKAFAPLASWTVLDHALVRVYGVAEPAAVVVVAPASHLDDARHRLDLVGGPSGAPRSVVAGGPTRQESVAAGLAALPASVDTVLVHDAARALTPSALFDRVAAEVRATGDGVVPGLPVSDTIKRVDAGVVEATVDRGALAAVQTPQGFPRAVLERAYAESDRNETDDAALVSAIGHPVRVVPGEDLAFKITTPWDLNRAELLLGPDWDVLDARVGVGVDTHAFGDDPGAELWLAGLHWPGERALAGHSDGDAVCHAVVDALLSAAGMGDIGTVFGTGDPELEGAHGDVFLSRVRALLDGEPGYRIRNVAVQLIGERPRLGARRYEAEEKLMRILGAPVSISATTTDGVGALGRGEGVTAIATALLVAGRGPRPTP